MKDAYTNIATADTYNTSTEWTSATDAEKNGALLMGTLWIDQNYMCIVEDPVQDGIQAATSLLAEQYILDSLFTPQTDSIKSKSVTAGSVTTETEYVAGNQSEQSFPEVQLYLTMEYCTINTGLNIDLVRT